MPKWEITANVPVYECKRCNHKWIGRTDKKPTQCPACHSIAWDKERKVKNVET